MVLLPPFLCHRSKLFFTYPYFKLNFILDGYPVTFIGMLAISLITSATASMLKNKKPLPQNGNESLQRQSMRKFMPIFCARIT